MSAASLSALIKQELAVLKEKYLFSVDETLQDPVFDGVVNNFTLFFESIQRMYSKIGSLTSSLEAFSSELTSLSDALLDNYKLAVTSSSSTQEGDDTGWIISDCYKMREACNQIGRIDAPHSAISKYRRDLEYNVMGPLRSHINNCRQIKNIIDLRTRKLVELSAAERRGDAYNNHAQLRTEFEQVDQHLFDWFMILEEYRGDILDSLLQTIKYLEYEYFACSAHAIAGVLPARMEFRPMVEMTPKQLEHQLGIEKRANNELTTNITSDSCEEPVPGAVGRISDYSKKLIMKTCSSDTSSPTQDPPVDVLSLSSLLAQGFEEGPARKALRECRNDTQAALELLLNGKRESVSSAFPGDVRMPTTLKRIQRIKELKRRLAEKEELRVAAPQEATETAPLIDVGAQDFTSPSYQKPNLPQIDDLLFS